MKKLLIIAMGLIVLAGVSFGGQSGTSMMKADPKEVIQKGKIPPRTLPPGVKRGTRPLFPDIKTELRWELVRYVDRPNWPKHDAIVRLTATFTNMGGNLEHCPDPPCKVALRSLEPSSPPRVREVLAQRQFDSFRSGQTIRLVKDITVRCGEEFSPVFEALHDVDFNPNQYFYHDPDYSRPRGYDSNPGNDVKQIDCDDIERALWDVGCRPKMQ